MGIFKDFLKALEAEDITNQVDDEMKKAVGKQSVTSNSNNDNIMETDDILGIKKKQKNESQDEPQEDDDNNSSDLTDDETDDTDENDDMSSDEDIDNSDEMDEDINSDPQQSEEFTNKLRLRDNMILFYNILSSNINLLSEYIPKTITDVNKDIIPKISLNLLACKEALFNIITEEVEKLSYVELLRKYIALNRVYDLNIKMLDKYFDNIKLIETTKDKKRKTK